MKKRPKSIKPVPGERPKPGIAIVGNMNVGKSTLFARMCGAEKTSINFPGTTVTITRGQVRGTDLYVLDTPGIYSIFSRDEDETVSRDLLLPHHSAGDINGIILVADAKNLRRSIAIALQYAEYGLPMLMAVNMIDETASRGITIDYTMLSEILGIEVCTTVARDGIGVRRLIAKLGEMRSSLIRCEYPEKTEQFLTITEKLLRSPAFSARAAGLLLLAGDRSVEQYVARNFGEAMLVQLRDLAEEHRRENGIPFDVRLGTLYNNRADQIAKEIQTVDPPERSPFLAKFGDWCTELHTGIPIALAVITLLYLFVGKFGATLLVDAIQGLLFEQLIIPWIAVVVAYIPVPFLRDLIMDPNFGILPAGVFLALGLVMPAIFCFYLAFGILEDSGYLPRISILLDKVFQVMGLNGKGVIPLVMGFSCVTMAILTTRSLDTEKEKNIAAFLLFLGFPCAPLMAVMLIILEKMPFTATIAVFGLIFVQILASGFLANKVLPGARTHFIMEIPPMRIPKAKAVLRMAATKTYFFMKEAVPVFILASALVFFFDRFGGLALIKQVSRPVLSTLMGLPEQSTQVFIKTFVRRESGAAELEHLRQVYTNLQMVVNLLVMTFIAPCLNSTIVLFKERGIKRGMVIWMAVMLYAVVMGIVVNHGYRLLGITFS